MRREGPPKTPRDIAIGALAAQVMARRRYEDARAQMLRRASATPEVSPVVPETANRSLSTIVRALLGWVGEHAPFREKSKRKNIPERINTRSSAAEGLSIQLGVRVIDEDDVPHVATPLEKKKN